MEKKPIRYEKGSIRNMEMILSGFMVELGSLRGFAGFLIRWRGELTRPIGDH